MEKPAAYLVIKSGEDTVQVFLCPKSFLDDMGASFKANDKIEVTGSKVKQDGADLILAREVVKGDDNADAALQRRQAGLVGTIPGLSTLR